jgi:signal transduction histidine kinase
MDVVSVDADEFLQVMTNLIRNAIQSVSKQHAGAPGKGWVKISTRVVSSAIEILIADNGLGITEEVKKHLFEKHFTTKSKSEGTGIGLSISRRLIRAFEGNLALRDGAPGKGATFVIVMPLTFGSGIKTGAAS